MTRLKTTSESPKVMHKFIFNWIKSEQETLYALAAALEDQLAPVDPDNPPEDYQQITAWRLSELLLDRLSSTHLLDQVRSHLIGGAAP